MAGIKYISVTPVKVRINLKASRCAIENALFVHAFDYMVELTVTGCCIIATYGYF